MHRRSKIKTVAAVGGLVALLGLGKCALSMDEQFDPLGIYKVDTIKQGSGSLMIHYEDGQLRMESQEERYQRRHPDNYRR